MPETPTDRETACPRGPRAAVVRGPGRQRPAPRASAPFARAALDATWAGRACRRALLVTDENLARLVAAVRRGRWTGSAIDADVGRPAAGRGDARASTAPPTSTTDLVEHAGRPAHVRRRPRRAA